MTRTEIERLAARCFCVGFADDGPPSELLDLGLGGVVLFGRNLNAASIDEAAALTEGMRSRNNGPLVVCLDHEGGRVRRSETCGLSAVAAMRRVGELDDTDLARDVGRLFAMELRRIGVDLDFAPVVDVDTNPANPVIGDRSFGRDPQQVARLASAVIEGLQAEGVAACAKHFPGHGDTHQDSHHTLPRLPHDRERLDAVELVPFHAAAKAGVASIMSAHVVFEALDPTLPATMSKPAIDVLRKGIAYDGLVATDCLEMHAITDDFGVERAVVAAMNAGVDWLLVSHSPERQLAAHAAIVRAVTDGEISEARLEQAASRVAAVADQYARGVVQPDETEIRNLRDRVLSRLADAAQAPDPTEQLA